MYFCGWNEQALAIALGSGHCHSLQELDLSRTRLSLGGFTAVTHALQQGHCPDLRRLGLSFCCLWAADGRALGVALRSGHIGKVEELDLSGNDMGDDGLIPVLEALEAGCCPNLRRLSLQYGKWGVQRKCRWWLGMPLLYIGVYVCTYSCP